MKKLIQRKTLWMSLASSLILVLFMLMAGGSIVKDLLSQFYLPEISRKTLENDQIQETHEYMDSYFCEERVWYYKLTGYYDNHMRWHGLLKIEKIIEDHGTEKLVYTEEVMMVHGKRDGLSTTTHRDGRTTHKVYNMGHEVGDAGGEFKSTGAVTAFSILDGNYSWQQEMFHDLGYEDIFLEAYLDTFELLLGTYNFGIEVLDSIYDEVDDRLGDTRFDTLTRLNTNFFSFVNGMELLKDAEFRMAVIDQYREDKASLFEVLQSTYPGYLTSMEHEGVNETDFAGFSQVFDSCMTSYGPFEKADPVTLIDSLDTRIYRALTGIYNSGQTKSTIRTFQKPEDVPELLTIPIQTSELTNSAPPDVAEVVLTDLLRLYIEGNIFRQCIRTSWSINQGLILLPTLTTSPVVPLSPGSAGITGFILDDGGAPVSSRGIVWAAHHNPTLEDHVEASGTGTGSFTVEIQGLDEGKTYFARSYATNLSGTAYGNCISFTTTATHLERLSSPRCAMELFPNPASEFMWIHTNEPLSLHATIHIMQLNGQEVYQLQASELVQHTQGVRMNLSSLAGGTYICQLRKGGKLIAAEKFILIK
jgi:hypothetical protein